VVFGFAKAHPQPRHLPRLPAPGERLGQIAVADESHEIAAIPELLRVLDLKGA
jgi:hypothetical protein